MEQESDLIKKNFKVSGMTCAACAISLETYLKPMPGIDEVSVNYPNQSVFIGYHQSIVSIAAIQKKAKEIGYVVLSGDELEGENTFEKMEEKRLKTFKSKLIFSAVFSVPVFLISMFFMGKIPYENWIMLALSTPVLLWSGSEFFITAWQKIKHLSANMDTLVALSTGVAFLFSVFNTVFPHYFMRIGIMPHVYFESAVIIITFILLGRFFEEKAKRKTSSAIRKLMGLKPKQVTVIRNGEEEIISYNEILQGELIIVKPGDKIPVDGKVKKGESYIDESMISGEPIPVSKIKGDDVFAGTINQKGSLRILATKVGDETLLSQIIKLVEQAQASKPEIQKLADRIAGIFVPVVIGISMITFSIWYFFGPEPTFNFAILALITVLIIACPCALGLATPTALMVGIGKGAENGILIKDAQVLETAYKIDTLVLDKTGTITEGKPKVTDFIWEKETNSDLFENILFSIESQSEHPLAESIVEYFKNKNASQVSVESFKSITGMGAEAEFEGVNYRVGSERFMRLNNVLMSEYILLEAERLKMEAKTLVYFAQGNEVKATIAISDKIKESTFSAIQQIQNMGIEIIMLTGDNEKTASVISEKIGIREFKANVLPAEKGAFIKQLQTKGRVVAMAGDGINDSHALAQADVGIAMGSGTDIAMESAGITLIHSDLKQIAKAIHLSKATMHTIRQNLFWAFVYNLVAIPVAAGVLYSAYGFLLNPMIAGAAMSLSSISVLTNSLRLKKRSF